MLPSGVRPRAVAVAPVTLCALLAATSTARADDPRDLFGLRKPAPKADDAPGCEEPGTFGCASVTAPLDDEAPLALSTWLPAAYLRSLPVGYTTHDSVAHYALGASRDETGVVLGGATGLENRWTIDGAPSDSIRTGASETRVPLAFLDGILVRAGGFTARDRTSTGGTIDARLRRGGTTHEVEASVWAGLTGESRRRPLAKGSYSVRRLTVDAGPEVAASLVATGPLLRVLGGTTWYAAGIAPFVTATDATWRASELVDANGDGVVDEVDGLAVLQPISVTDDRSIDFLVPAMLRTGYDRGAHHVELTLIGHATRTTRWLANATERAAGIERTSLVADGIATWRGHWKSTRAMVQLAWHRSDTRESPDDPSANVPQLLSAYIPTSLPEDPVLAEKCSDATYPDIPQCPVLTSYFASGGAGLLVDTVGDRPTATAEIAHQIGRHVLRAGTTLEDARLVLRSRLTGGEQYRSLFPGHVDTLRFFAGDCGEQPGTPCGYVDVSELRYRTRYTAAYVEDTFSPQDGLRVDGGLRWELMWVGPRLHFSNQLAPRLGIAWDFLGHGRSRLWASMGRSYVLLPAGVGATVIRRDATVHDATSEFGESRDYDGGAAYRIPAGIEPMSQDELTAGLELGIARTFRLIAWAQGRYLRRGLETTPDGFDNPGRIHGDPARRATEQLAVEIATAPTAKLVLRVGYLLGRTHGNYLGAYDPQLGAILYGGRSWDGPATSENLIGALPTDAGHRVFVEGSRRGSVGGVQLQVATRLTVASGRPRSAFADTDLGWVAVIRRGSLGRGPMLSQANVRVAARWRGLDITLDVFNAFDQATSTLVDEYYAQAIAHPIEGGSPEDLVFWKTPEGDTPRRRTAFGLPVAFQGPISAVLGVHHAF